MVHNTTAPKYSLYLAAFSLICLFASLLLPAVRTNVFGSPATFYGWQATAWAVGLGMDTAAHSFEVHASDIARFTILGIAAISNATFVIVPIFLSKGSTSRIALLWLGGLSLTGLICGAAAPFSISSMNLVTLIGYYVWLLGYATLIGSVGIAWRNVVRTKSS